MNRAPINEDELSEFIASHSTEAINEENASDASAGALSLVEDASSGALSLGTRPVEAKYGKAAIAGFQPVPDLLLKHQNNLNLSSTDLVVLLNVLMHWWYPEQKPFPRSSRISKRMGVSNRTVQRSLGHLEAEGLLLKVKGNDGTVYLDPAQLVTRLSEIAETDAEYISRVRRREGR